MIPGFKHEVKPYNTGNNLHIVMQLMEQFKADIWWVMPDDDFSINISYEDFNFIPSSFSWYSPPENIYDGQPYILRLKRKEPYGSPDKYIVFPGHMECCIPRSGDRGQWQILNQPNNLRTTLDYIENELGIPYIWTNGNVGEHYLRKCHEDIKTHILPLPKEQIEPFKQVLHGAMDRLVWRKTIPIVGSGQIERGQYGLTPTDIEKGFIVGFDKNGQFVGSSNAVYLGNGEFTFALYFKKDYVGFWQYEIEDVSNTSFNGYDLPCPLDVNRKWASTALINAALEVGLKLSIGPGIIFQKQGRYLQKWASNLWQHRVNLRDSTKYPSYPARENAERTMKAIPNSMVGRFMNEYSKEYFHPDWQLGIVHQAIASQTYSMRHWLQDYGLKPILVNKDAVYFLVDDKEEVDFLQSRSSQLGGFKFIGQAPISESIIEAFSEEKSINKLESLIKREIKEYVQKESIH